MSRIHTLPMSRATRALLAAAALAALPAAHAQPAAEIAGRIEFATAGAIATDAGGRTRMLTRGTELRAGDRILTNAGRAQIRFADGAFVSLQPNTDFAIQNYHYAGRVDGNERSFFALLKGAMRAVTGVIGHANKSNFALRTPTTTIGIRGTGGLIEVLPDGTTRLIGSSGIWTVANQVAMVEVPAGRAVEVHPGVKAPPQYITQAPVLPPAPMDSATTRQTTAMNLATGYVAGDIVQPNGSSAYTLASGTNYDMSSVYVTGTTLYMPHGVGPTTFNAIGQLTEFTSGGTIYSLGAGQIADAGAVAGVMSWGRWTGTVSVGGQPTSFSSNDGLHYVVGVPAAYADVTNGTVATFHLIGGTNPTNGVATGTLNPNSTLTGYFTATNPSVGVNLGLSIAGNSYQLQTATPIPIIAANGSQTSFSGSGTALTVSGGGSCATGGCSAAVAGQFFGSGANYAGMSYNIASGSTVVANGAAAFQR